MKKIFISKKEENKVTIILVLLPGQPLWRLTLLVIALF